MQAQFMHLAFAKAQEGIKKGVGGPFGAAVVKGDRVLAVASNRVLGDQDPTAHAEINAIREAGRILKTHDLSGCEIYATGYPCPMCLAAIIWANISVCYFANPVQAAEEIGFRDQMIYQHLQGQKKALELKQLADSEYCLELYADYQKQQGVIY